MIAYYVNISRKFVRGGVIVSYININRKSSEGVWCVLSLSNVVYGIRLLVEMGVLRTNSTVLFCLYPVYVIKVRGRTRTPVHA